MNEAAIRTKLNQIHETVKGWPLRGIGTAAEAGESGTYLSTTQEDASVEERLDQLRLQVKYLVFDLEATRRENRYLRQMLDSRRRDGEQ